MARGACTGARGLLRQLGLARRATARGSTPAVAAPACALGSLPGHARSLQTAPVASESTAPVPPVAAPALGRSESQLWELLEYNSHYFNPHRLAPLLAQLLEEPRARARADPRLAAYLRHAAASAQLYEHLRELPAKEIATAINAARDLGHDDAEDLSDVLVATVSAQLRGLSAQRVSFFITAFAKQKIADARFWRAAGAAVAETTEFFSPQVLVSLFDAFRKSGLRSERLYSVLAHRVYGVLDDLQPAHIPPIVATVGRVPLPQQERERVTRALLGRWLSMLRQERELAVGAVTVQQILSLTVTLGLMPEEINTAVFARDVSSFVGDRFELLKVEDLIVFLWAMQRLVPVGSLSDFFARGLKQVLKLWSELQATAELSVQRLTQLSDVLVQARQEPAHGRALKPLEVMLLAELSESVQHCLPEGLAELLEIWAGNEAFWRHYRDFAEAVVKRIEEVLLECGDFREVLPVLQALLAIPGLLSSLPEDSRRILAGAVQSRGASDVERIKAVLAGSPWEVLCFKDAQAPGSAPSGSADSDAAGPLVSRKSGTVASGDKPDDTEDAFSPLLESWKRPSTDPEVASFLRAACARARGVEDILQALEAVAPFVQRLGPSASGEVLQLLEQLGDGLTASIHKLPPPCILTALHACAVAGLPHAPLFAAATLRLDSRAGAMPLVEALEACAALRLKIPELQAWFDRLMAEGLERRLPSAGLARLLAAAARLALLEQQTVDRLLQRLITVASPVRPLQLDSLATLCHGLYLARHSPGGAALWQLASWLAQAEGAQPAPPQAAALCRFALALLADRGRREEVEALPPESQRALARAIRSAGSQRTPTSDTTLKFRHEVAEALRSAGIPYDLDLTLGPGIGAELALLSLGHSQSTGSGGPLWLLDGPEAFHRPFAAPGGALLLVPAEQRRAELLNVLREQQAVAELEEAVFRWESQGLDAGGLAATPRRLGLGASACGGRPLARLHWLQWAELTPAERVAALTRPGPHHLCENQPAMT